LNNFGWETVVDVDIGHTHLKKGREEGKEVTKLDFTQLNKRSVPLLKKKTRNEWMTK
jgi:hypothetical protein